MTLGAGSVEGLLPQRSALVTHVRGTLLLSSLLSLSEAGLRAAYFDSLPSRRHGEIVQLVANEWVPIELARAHYDACNRLPLTGEEQARLGGGVAKRLTSGLIGTLVRMTKVAGFLPGTQVDHYSRVWQRLFKGGVVSVSLHGPKEVQLVLAGMPLSEIAYYRNATRGLQLGMFSLLGSRDHRSPPAARQPVSAAGASITVQASRVEASCGGLAVGRDSALGPPMTRQRLLRAFNLALFAAAGVACGGQVSSIDQQQDAAGVDAAGSCAVVKNTGPGTCGWSVTLAGDPALCSIPTDAGVIPTDVCNRLCGPDSNHQPTTICYWNSYNPESLQCGRGCTGRRPAGLEPMGETSADVVLAYFMEMAHLEAASIPAFRILADELAAHGAPVSLRGAARAAARDEVRHAHAVSRIVESLGGRAHAPVVHRGPVRPLVDIAIENAVEGCVGETWGALVAAWQADHAEPQLRQMFEEIARDEAEHANLGWQVSAWIATRLTPEERARVEAARRTATLALLSSLEAAPAEALVAVAGLPRREQALAMARAFFSDLALAA